MRIRKHHPTPAELGLTPEEGRVLSALTTPQHIQEFVVGLHANFEEDGDCLRSVRGVLRHRRAHCIEGAFVAACALWLQGEPPLIMDLTAKGDSDHVIAIFRRHGCWGAISKSNHVWLRWRDRSIEACANWRCRTSTNTPTSIARPCGPTPRPVGLDRFPTETWITNEEDCWDVGAALDDVRHYRLITPAQARRLMPRDATELRADDLVQYESRDRRRARRY